MIKKLFLMGIGIVLSSIITTTSFAWTPPSQECRDARIVYSKIMTTLQQCKGGTTNWKLWCDELEELRNCKTLGLARVRAICPHGDENIIEDKDFLENCMDFFKEQLVCACDCDMVWYKAFTSDKACGKYIATGADPAPWTNCYPCDLCSEEGEDIGECSSEEFCILESKCGERIWSFGEFSSWNKCETFVETAGGGPYICSLCTDANLNPSDCYCERGRCGYCEGDKKCGGG